MRLPVLSLALLVCVCVLASQWTGVSSKFSEGSVGSWSNPGKSCLAVLRAPGRAPSGWYVLRTGKRKEYRYCEMNRWGGGWTFLGQMKPRHWHTCPRGFAYSGHLGGMCMRPPNGRGSESTVSFSTRGMRYTEVMGYVKGFQYFTTDAFGLARNKRIYVDGVTIRYGNEHLWTYGAGGHPAKHVQCPCKGGPKAPAYVGSHYYCTQDPAATYGHKWVPAWHGSCGGKNCCPARGFPWFKRSLGKSTTSSIRVTAMCDQSTGDENVAISDMELYVR